ncbi:hypothetical protein ACQ4LE_002889 [Meloidogyne hapla]
MLLNKIEFGFILFCFLNLFIEIKSNNKTTKNQNYNSFSLLGEENEGVEEYIENQEKSKQLISPKEEENEDKLIEKSDDFEMIEIMKNLYKIEGRTDNDDYLLLKLFSKQILLI